MKIISIILIIAEFLVSWSAGQALFAPELAMGEMTWTERGTFMVDKCSQELVNCWLVAPASAVCAKINGNHTRTFESMCSLLHYYCMNPSEDINQMDSAEGLCPT